jgi:anthranilate synthase component 2
MNKSLLILDNYDSFTYNLADYLHQEGITCEIKRNNSSLDKIKKGNFSGIVISPGPGKPEDAGITMPLLDHFHNKLPILGICLGHQAIGKYFGSTVGKAKVPMHGKISKIHCIEDPIFRNIPSTFNVVRYHSLLIDQLSDNLIPLAMSAENEVMVIKHKEFSIYGIQYHPEAILTEYGKKILQNWIILNNIHN